MKILHWDETFHPCFGYQINVLPKYHAMQGHEVTIVTSENIESHPMFKGFTQPQDIAHEDELYSRKYGIKIIRLPIHTIISHRVIFKKGYVEAIKNLNPDIIMCHFSDSWGSIRITQKHRIINVPIVFDTHMLEMASRNPLRGLFRLYHRLFVTPIIKDNRYIVIRTQNDPYVNKYFHIPENQTPFISFGSDTTLFFPDEAVKKSFRDELGLKRDDFVVIYAGKLDEAKNGLLLAQTVEKKFETTRNVVVLVIGNTHGEYGKKVDEVFARSENRIIRVPTQRYIDLANFYQVADLSVFPKQCSLSFYDVQACGLPVVSEDNNINEERVRYGNGFTFQSGNIDSFRKEILKCAEMDTDDYDQIRRNSLNYIRENYDYKLIAQKYTDILTEEYHRLSKSYKDHTGSRNKQKGK